MITKKSHIDSFKFGEFDSHLMAMLSLETKLLIGPSFPELEGSQHVYLKAAKTQTHRDFERLILPFIYK